jgi:diamine oxidase
VGSQRFTQIRIMFAVDGTWRGKDLNPVPFSFTINGTDVDPSMWTADDFWYNLQGPFTKDALVEKYMNGELEKIVIPESHYIEIQKLTFPQRRPEYPERPYADKPGPRVYMPEGPRYTISGRTVNWMGWSFHAGYNFRAGPNFKNIMFNGERVAYEVALNEIGLIYSANDPVGANVFFMDSNFGNGEYRELIKGVDCPDYATYLTNYWWAAPGGPVAAEGSMCVFETTTSEVLWRRGGPFVSGLPATELNVRFAMPNGNYDYIVTYKFKLDGVMRVDAASSGYIQTYFMPPDRGPKDPFSYRLHTYTGGSLHDHTFGFKVDLDIVNEENTFETIAFKTGSTLDAVNSGLDEPLDTQPEYLLYPTTRYVEHTTIQTENEALMSINPMAPKEWFFGDTTSKNKWGNTRGFTLHLDQNPSSMIPEGHHSLPAYDYGKNMLAVTLQKEDEQTISGAYDLNRLDDPLGSFSRCVDDEDIVQKDLVAWVTLSLLHLPISENMPMTNLVRTGFTLAPHNFFDEDPAMDLPHYLRMNNGALPNDMRMEDLPTVPDCVPYEYDTTHTFSGA